MILLQLSLQLLQTAIMCLAVAESAKTKLLHSFGNPKRGRAPLPYPPPHLQTLAQDLPEHTAGHVTYLSSGGTGRDTSPLSPQFSGEGQTQGRASIQSTLFCFSLAQCLLRPEKKPGLLIILVLNGVFRIGHVKVRGLKINHTGSFFPQLNLWMFSYQTSHCKDFTFVTQINTVTHYLPIKNIKCYMMPCLGVTDVCCVWPKSAADTNTHTQKKFTVKLEPSFQTNVTDGEK